MSILLRTTIIFFMKSSAIMMHSAVCAWIPFVISIIRNIMSMIWAPPIIVLINDACPGQSTSVNCRYYSLSSCSNRMGTLVKNAEKPKSRVMPLSWDWGFLSRLAVDITSLKMRQSDVFPESTWPSTPMLMLRHFCGGIAAIYSFVKSKRSFSINYKLLTSKFFDYRILKRLFNA